jgi:acetyl-CoA carboxylase carboxyl transferase subunit beta
LAGRLGLPLVTLIDTPGADPSPAAEAAGIAAAIGEAMDAVLACPSPTVSVVVGEGGSGGAIAAACADVLLVTADSYVAALSPEGAAVTLRTSPSKAADASGLRPVDLMRLGVADGVVTGTDVDLMRTVAITVRNLSVRDRTVRLANRHAKWSTAATGRL